MDKLKLVRIIAKDLEELKTLTEEVAENQDDSTLVIDLALGRARLLCQELELLRSLSTPEPPANDEAQDENFEDDEIEELGQTASDPELEILHFEEQDFPEPEEITEEDQVVYDADEDDEFVEESEEEPELEDDLTEDDLENTGVEETLPDESRDIEDEDEYIASIEEEETAEDDEEKEEEPAPEEEIHEEDPVQPVQPTVREIKITDLDDEEEEKIEFSPISAPLNRPVMREIPKPEIPFPTEEEKEEEEEEEDNDEEEIPVAEETPQKERSLNETLGENKAAETNLSNTPITSLRAAIGLNDRFLFIREIFNNNSEKYNTIIDQLDQMETIQQAVDYLKVNLSLQKNDTSLKFVDLLKRRFSK